MQADARDALGHLVTLMPFYATEDAPALFDAAEELDMREKEHLHRDIMNIPCVVPGGEDHQGVADGAWVSGFKRGHRSARHAAAELVAMHRETSAEPQDPIYRGKCDDGSHCIHGCHRTEPCHLAPTGELTADLFKVAMFGDRGNQKKLAERISEVLRAHSPTADPTEAEQVCFETYAAIGMILMGLAEKGHPQAEKLMDNLSQARMVHKDVVPFEEVADQRRQELLSGQWDWSKVAERAGGVTPCQTEQECEVPALCKETGGCERMEPVCSRGCPSTEVCKAIRSGGECTRGVKENQRG